MKTKFILSSIILFLLIIILQVNSTVEAKPDMKVCSSVFSVENVEAELQNKIEVIEAENHKIFSISVVNTTDKDKLLCIITYIQ